MIWYLVESDAAKRTTVVQPFLNTEKANAAYSARELEIWDGRCETLSDYTLRVCLFGADKLATLRKTHGNWFHRDTKVLAPIR